jgi:hypothetical protein
MCAWPTSWIMGVSRPPDQRLVDQLAAVAAIECDHVTYMDSLPWYTSDPFRTELYAVTKRIKRVFARRWL